MTGNLTEQAVSQKEANCEHEDDIVLDPTETLEDTKV